MITAVLHGDRSPPARPPHVPGSSRGETPPPAGLVRALRAGHNESTTAVATGGQAAQVPIQGPGTCQHGETARPARRTRAEQAWNKCAGSPLAYAHHRSFFDGAAPRTGGICAQPSDNRHASQAHRFSVRIARARDRQSRRVTMTVTAIARDPPIWLDLHYVERVIACVVRRTELPAMASPKATD